MVILITMKKDEKTGYYINEVNGRKYAYIQKTHVWNKEKKQAETSLEYIGRLDDNGKLVPKRRHLVKAEMSEETKLSIVDQNRVGMVRVLWQIATEIKLNETLKAAFPKTWDTILSLSFYYVSSGRNAAYLYSSWQEDHESPIKGKSLEGPDITRLFSEMEEARRKDFLKRWRNAASSGKACFNDITSISSYSKENEMVEFGYNRDHEDLPQINLGLIVDSGSKLPLYYHVHDGSIRDVSTLERVMREGFAFNMKNLLFVMDKGFYATHNINSMYSFNYHFIVAIPLSAGKAKDAIDEARSSIRHPSNIIVTGNGEAVYAKTSSLQYWSNEDFHWPCRIHVYTSDNEDAGKRGMKLDMKLAECFRELNEGNWNDAHVSLYAKYFDMNIKTVDGVEKKTYSYKEKALKDAESHYAGYFAIVTDQVDLSSREVLEIYRSKDAVEKAFYDLKNEQDAKRLGTHSAKAMDGKLFTLFISSILISEIRRRMDGFNGQWTLNSIRTALDKITFSKVKIEHLKKAKELKGLVSKTQREYLAKLLDCPPNEAADKLFSIQMS